MNFKQCKINGIDVIQNGILYTYVNRRQLATDDQSKNIEGSHGRIVSPTYARYRIITLEGVIDRLTSSKDENNLYHLENIFALQYDLKDKLEEKELYIKDLYDNERILNVKVKEPLEIIEGDENLKGSHWKWRVVLESTRSPVYKSVTELFVTGVESTYGGLTLGTVLPTALDKYIEYIEVFFNSNSYTRFEIEVTKEINSPLKIINLTTHTFFGLDINAVAGDKIVIDSENMTCTKNDENIISQRIEGSSWQNLIGKNILIITDEEGGVMSNDFNVKIYYSNTLL